MLCFHCRYTYFLDRSSLNDTSSGLQDTLRGLHDTSNSLKDTLSDLWDIQEATRISSGILNTSIGPQNTSKGIHNTSVDSLTLNCKQTLVNLKLPPRYLSGLRDISVDSLTLNCKQTSSYLQDISVASEISQWPPGHFMWLQVTFGTLEGTRETLQVSCGTPWEN